MRCFLFFLTLSSLAACAQAAPHASGVAGRIMLSPAGPGPQRIGQQVAGAPAAGLALELRSGERVVAQAVSAPGGAFVLRAPPGSYVLHVAIDGMYPRCQDLPIRVRKGRLARAELRCDSGMR